ncbi:PHD finger protein 3 [Synchiropus splendidus]|uniref:PHD finger protein 3 n=1 Tax=Synchiropus splendidus TaxID=270530 RepID=UPI00237D41B2|nr:PHD finger protein 3 [Synchiropus splendidus]XP_053731660.1 PHD finger protein 3 [Synchiropus splendidus]
MDIVDTFNHLIPSDQLDDSLVIGQNLECEASNEFGPGPQLDDSLKNMLSDKDPMFGCASSHFNLLDNEDPSFHMSGSAAGLGSIPTGLEETPRVKLPVGRPRKRPRHVEIDHIGDTDVSKNSVQPAPHNPSQSFLIEKGVQGSQLKKELTEGGRININDLDGGLWLNPSVELRRLTVTIGGFRIELLPGPSYIQTTDPMMDDSFAFDENLGFPVLPDDAIGANKHIQEVAQVDVVESGFDDEATLALGPYVNPNDVQKSNGADVMFPYTQKTKVDNQIVPGNKRSVCHKKDAIQPNNKGNKIIGATNVKGNQTAVKSLHRPKEGLMSPKSKHVALTKTSTMVKTHKDSDITPSKVIPKGDMHKIKSPKEKKITDPLKRPADANPGIPGAKLQKLQMNTDHKAKPKSSVIPTSPLKKTATSGNRSSDLHSPKKPSHLANSHKVEPANQTHSRPDNSLRSPDDGGQEKPKVKKPEKILPKQKSKTPRSISVDEPQLFIPDNAPVVAKKDSAEEQSAHVEEAVWDGNNCCGLCKKHHNNLFMVGCGRCEDWFHGDCVGLDLTKVHEMEEEDQMYVCLRCCEEESKKVETEMPSTNVMAETKEKTEAKAQDLKPASKAKPGPSQSLSSGGVRPVRKDADRRLSVDVKEASHKTGGKLEARSKSSSSAKKPASVEEIRRSVRDSLKEILIQRLKESDLKISVEKAYEVAKKTERELFHLYKDTENKYKNKYRSLMFNLKDTKNNVLYKRVLRGEISPASLIRMSPEELASKELAAWRKRENRHTIEMIEKEQREAERRPITKITHKGEIEIESQEPAKAPEPAEPASPVKVAEVVVEPPKALEKKADSVETEKDTTHQHKSHLFDLHCKICTGRMAPPVEEAPNKVLKVATTVVRRQSAISEEPKTTNPPGVDDDALHAVLEESLRSAQSSYEGRSEHTVGREVETAFLSNLKSLWRGFINMHAVAKLVTKAFPVSGVLDNLIQDLPDSIQVGGRISPQIVWDYFEKIRATGTKEVCLIRFSPETEEDEISYTLLYAYFSSRKRYGVVSNNLKQVKDMYLIPLGATEKVPQQLVPFDGPGLESNRNNLLLGLIIRQRPKRDFLPVDLNETARVIPEVKPISISPKQSKAAGVEESFFLTAIPAAMKTEKETQPKAIEEEVEEEEPVEESFDETSATEESGSQESLKPLRFLPGVLVGWGGELPPLPDFSEKSKPSAEEVPTVSSASKTEAPKSTVQRERFVIKKKESKTIKVEPEDSTNSDKPGASDSSGKEAPALPQRVGLSLKDKPPDVSTTAFLASLSTPQISTESTDTALDKEAETGTNGGQSVSNGSKPPLSGILKKSSVYPVNEDTSHKSEDPPKPAAAEGLKKQTITTFHQGYLQMSQAERKTKEQTAVGNTVTTDEQPKPDSCVPAESLSDRPDPHENNLSSALSPNPDDNDHSVTSDSESASHSLSSEHSSQYRDTKRQDELYSDPWERPRNTEDRHKRDHRGPHHGKKSRHHDREREKPERGYDDKYRERSRHHSHSEDRYGDRRKERQHSDDYASRHKERHRHRRDSDNGRRSSKDSYS